MTRKVSRGGKFGLNFTNPYKKPADILKKRDKRHAREQAVLKLEALVLLGLVLVVMFFGFRLSSDPVVNISGGSYTSSAVSRIEDAAKASVSDQISSRISARIKPFVPREDILASLNSIPEVKSANLTIPRSGSRPIVNLQLEDISVLYRRGASTYLLSTSGVVVAPRDSLISADDLPVIDDSLFALDDLSFGTTVVSRQVIQSVLALDKVLGGQGSGVPAVERYELGVNPSELTAILASGQELVFISDDRVAEQGASVKLFIESLASDELQNLTRIDGRIVGRVVYK